MIPAKVSFKVKSTGYGRANQIYKIFFIQQFKVFRFLSSLYRVRFSGLLPIELSLSMCNENQ